MPEQLREQKAAFPAQFPTGQERRQDTYRRPVHTDDVDEDTLYDVRQPTSVRRYVPPAPQRIVMRVTHHTIPPRASLRQVPSQDEQPAPAQQQSTLRPLFLVGVGMVLALLLVIGGHLAVAKWNDLQNTLHYGYPRTFQCDADVGHGGVSHFIAQNLHGHVFIIELHATTPGKTMLYVGPVLTGVGADREPVTISFQDVNGDHLPDMLLQVGPTEYVYPNTGQGFRITMQPSKIGV
jgi:hypothetical protein